MSAPQRPDLLSLGPEELELFSNRGTVRRAGADLEDTALSVLWEPGEDGSFTAVWSDGAKVSFPDAGTLREARCTCPASASSMSVCRHVVRTVLALRLLAAEDAADTTDTGSWNPGSISDEDIAAFCSTVNLARAKALMEQGLLVKVILQVTPLVRIHGLGTTVRFLARGDIRYAKVDIEGPAAMQSTAIAVIAARGLPPGHEAGWVQTGSRRREIPSGLFTDTEKTLSELFTWGVSRVSMAFPTTLRNLAWRHKEECLTWLADTLEEAALGMERYQERNALFSPDAVADAVAEWLARHDAFCTTICAASDTTARKIPWMLVGGTRFDRDRDISHLRLTGLGSSVKLTSSGATLIAWLFDEDTGNVLTAEKAYPDPSEGEPKDFHSLASLPAIPGVRFQDLASGRLIGSGGHASAAGKLSFGRKASASPQTFSWEKLRDGFLVDDYRELATEAGDRPPAFLRSRRRGEDIVALKVASAEGARFDGARQEIHFIARDAYGTAVLVALPWISRAAEGLEGLLSHLSDPEWKLLFLSGSLKTTVRGLEIFPIAFVFDVDGERIMLQPWIDARAHSRSSLTEVASYSVKSRTGAVKEILALLQEAIGETLLIGKKGHGKELAALWKNIAHQAEVRGSVLLAGKAAALADAFEEGLHSLAESHSEQLFCELLVLTLTARHVA